MFELNKQEIRNLRSQFVTSSWGDSRYLPMAFTEQGVATKIKKSKGNYGDWTEYDQGWSTQSISNFV